MISPLSVTPQGLVILDPNHRGILGTCPGPPGAASLAHHHNVSITMFLYRDHDHCGRPWAVTVDVPRPKDPPGTVRVAFHALMADNSRDYINSTSLWDPATRTWSGTWTPTKPRAVPPAVREAVEAALQQLQEVA